MRHRLLALLLLSGLVRPAAGQDTLVTRYRCIGMMAQCGTQATASGAVVLTTSPLAGDSGTVKVVCAAPGAAVTLTVTLTGITPGMTTSAPTASARVSGSCPMLVLGDTTTVTLPLVIASPGSITVRGPVTLTGYSGASVRWAANVTLSAPVDSLGTATATIILRGPLDTVAWLRRPAGRPASFTLVYDLRADSNGKRADFAPLLNWRPAVGPPLALLPVAFTDTAYVEITVIDGAGGLVLRPNFPAATVRAMLSLLQRGRPFTMTFAPPYRVVLPARPVRIGVGS